MFQMKNSYIYYIVGTVLTVLGFVLLSEVSQQHNGFLEGFVHQAGLVGIFSYIGLLIVAVVIAPISTFFLVPVAANSWGPLLAAVYTVLGWTIGSMIAFYLARRYGLKWVGKMEKVKRMREIEVAIPRRHVFIFVTLLRSTIPVDILSYALGIFSTIGYRSFLFSTIIGITPFTLLLTYASTSTAQIQVAVICFGAVLFSVSSYYIYSKNKMYNKLHE